MPIGCDSVETHRGQIMTGNRSTSARISSNDRLPDPITTDARNSTTGTPLSRSTCPVSIRLLRCLLHASSPVARPPRYTIRRTPVRRAASPKLRAAMRSVLR